MSNEGIDFVITWVDGGDPAWRAEKAGYSPGKNSDDREERYRDWEQLVYFFRGVEKHAPWVRKIHFVTWGHIPPWLNTLHPKLHIVRHEDYIPRKYLPLFNSCAIEAHLHRIKGLSEHFVYFNDDIFLIDKASPEMFFKNGKPCDMLAFQPVVANPANPTMSYMYMKESVLLSKHFNKRENIKKQPGKYFKIGYPPLYFFYNLLEISFPLFTGFYTAHNPFPLCKSTMETVWEMEREELEETSRHRFRDKEDVMPYIFREWQKLSGNFTPRNIHRYFKYFNVSSENSRLVSCILKQKAPILCINDANKAIDFEKAKAEINNAFDAIFPEKSSFEI